MLNLSKTAQIIGFTPPKLYTGARWYIGFYAYDPITGRLKRKTIKINRIAGHKERRAYANGLIKRINQQLNEGWNPWVESISSDAFLLFNDVIDRYKKYIDRMFIAGTYREETYKSYLSYIKNLCNWNSSRSIPIKYIYQFDKHFISAFLDYLYLDREVSTQTRDNYLAFLRVISSWLIQNGIMKERPTDGIKSFGKRSHKKQRTIIPDNDIIRLQEYLLQKNKHFLLACYILHYCFIRPKEMSQLRISNFSIKNKTVFIPGSISKNRQDGTVTLPNKITKLMIELGIFNHCGQEYLFSEGFMPGNRYKSEKTFRDYWLNHIVRDLKFPKEYKFYSLKDTGITSMLRQYDRLTVRDQARHSSILMTDIYTPHDIQEANHLIVAHKGIF